MTPKERAVMQQALEALHNTQNALLFVSGSIEQFIISNMTADAHDDADKAITALREALAEQAEQEPVGYIDAADLRNCGQAVEKTAQKPAAWFKHGPYDDGEEPVCVFTDPHDDVCYSPLGFIEYVAPQPVQEDHDGHWSDCSVHNEPAYPNGPCDCGGYPPKQEPIGYIDAADLRELYNGNERQYSLFTEDKGRMIALYAAPVRTKYLTDDEIVHLVNSVWFLDELVVAKVNFARAAIAAYKEKNRG